MNERELIERIRSLFPAKTAALGIGDDAAIVRCDRQLVVTTDMLVEDVDFTPSIPLRFMARKSLAANLSDLAAMGARPLWFLLALAFPPELSARIDEYLVALAEAAGEHRVELLGGDLSRGPKLTIAISAAGRMDDGSAPLLRSGARPGDRLFLSRPIGGSATGLHLLRSGWSIAGSGSVAPPDSGAGRYGYALEELAGSAIRRHVDPVPEVALGLALSRSGAATACIDLSDGLSTDLQHLCTASGCGAEIEQERIPVLPDLGSAATTFGIDVRDAVLHGGEEFALLFTSPLRESELSRQVGRPVYAIGRMTEGPEVMVRSGSEIAPLPSHGFDHFAA
jgi:thiamine-monophosphate kinase